MMFPCFLSATASFGLSYSLCSEQSQDLLSVVLVEGFFASPFSSAPSLFFSIPFVFAHFLRNDEELLQHLAS